MRRSNLMAIALIVNKSDNGENIFSAVIRDKYLPLATDPVTKVQVNSTDNGVDIWFENAGHRGITC